MLSCWLWSCSKGKSHETRDCEVPFHCFLVENMPAVLAKSLMFETQPEYTNIQTLKSIQATYPTTFPDLLRYQKTSWDRVDGPRKHPSFSAVSWPSCDKEVVIWRSSWRSVALRMFFSKSTMPAWWKSRIRLGRTALMPWVETIFFLRFVSLWRKPIWRSAYEQISKAQKRS